MSLCSVITYHSLCLETLLVIALLLPQIRELSEPQLSLILISLAGDEDWPFSLGGQPGSQGEACPVYPRGPLLLPTAWRNHCSPQHDHAIVNYLERRCPLAGRIPVCFLFLYFSAQASIRSAFPDNSGCWVRESGYNKMIFRSEKKYNKPCWQGWRVTSVK